MRVSLRHLPEYSPTTSIIHSIMLIIDVFIPSEIRYNIQAEFAIYLYLLHPATAYPYPSNVVIEHAIPERRPAQLSKIRSCVVDFDCLFFANPEPTVERDDHTPPWGVAFDVSLLEVYANRGQ